MYLNNHSYFSLRYGTLSVEELVAAGKVLGVETMALTDINNTSAAFDFLAACEREKIQPILGIEFRNGDELLYTGIARNMAGFRELNEFLSIYQLSGTELPTTPIAFEQAYIIYPFARQGTVRLRENEFLGIRPGEVSQLYRSPYYQQQEKLIVWQPVTFKDEPGYRVHVLLRAVDHNTLLTKLQPHQHADRNEVLIAPGQLLRYYAEFPMIVRNTERLIGSCSFYFDFKSHKNKKTFSGDSYEDQILLERLTEEGMHYRYGKDHTEAQRRIDKELRMVRKLGFSAYFLITKDIINYAQHKGYHHVGRGSGANSIIAYCLQITDVDPIELDLYFERFINPHRTSPPDFDIDFSWDERDDVTRYIFERHGRAHVALLGTYNTFKGKSIMRELGKVFGLPKEEIDALIADPNAQHNRHQISDQIVHYGQYIQNFPNYLSIHAGGVLISEEPVNSYTAMQMMPKGFPITHFDMYVAEDIGLHKLDVLSQRGLGHIKDAADMVQRNQGIAIDVHDVPRFKQDPKVREQIRSGKTIGCFYVESPAMRGLLTKLRCDNYISLVAASSIIRPGVAKSGMMREYIYRFHHPNSFEYLHPVMKEQLEETYGVMIYQEDVIKVAHHFAGLDLNDADVLRRAMSGKTRSKKELQRIVDKFFSNCQRLGYPGELAKEVWRQIESFSGYSFSKAHSASYAVESYQSLYLKAYYPLEFMVAVINNFGGFYRSEVYFHEARMAGAKLEAPCVNHSLNLTTIKGKTIYMGFVHLRSLESKVAKTIVQEREANGPYQSLPDFLDRVSIALEQLILLIRVGALRFCGQPKKALLWEAHLLLGKGKSQAHDLRLFSEPTKSYQLPDLTTEPLEDIYDEIELLGFPLCSPFDLLQTKFRGEVTARTMIGQVGKTVKLVGYLVTTKNVVTVKGGRMKFGTWLDVEGDFFDTTHFPPALRRDPFRGGGLYLLKGKVVEDFGYPSIEIERMAKLPVQEDPRYVGQSEMEKMLREKERKEKERSA